MGIHSVLSLIKPTSPCTKGLKSTFDADEGRVVVGVGKTPQAFIICNTMVPTH